jgi:hypothetical protein
VALAAEYPSGDAAPTLGEATDLLNAFEQEWAPRLRGLSLVTEAEIPVEDGKRIAAALGSVYARLAEGPQSGLRLLLRRPACVAAAMVSAAAAGYERGAYWPALWAWAGCDPTQADQTAWGKAFSLSIEQLGLPTFSHLPLTNLGPILMHAGIPVYCLGDYFRLLLDRRRRDPGLDADGFLAWATSPGRESRLYVLDAPVRRFLAEGGEYSHDVVERTFDLLERLGEPDPDLAGVRLPVYMIEAARSEYQRGRLDVSAARRRPGAARGSQLRPRIGLDPYGEGVRVILPAVGEAPDGLATWSIAADGEVGTVRSRALWVGAAEAAPETSYPLARPVRAVSVSLAGSQLTAQLQVVEPSDPVLFFADDGRQAPGTLPLPRSRLWILHPAEQELDVSGAIAEIAEPPVPFGWEGWRLRLVSLESAQEVKLRASKRSHRVQDQSQPRLVLGDPVRGVSTPYGSPVYDRPPHLVLPGELNVPISWHIDIRPVADATRSLVSLDIDGSAEVDLGQHLPRPVVGAFDVTVRGPLARGLRRAIVLAEGLGGRYLPAVRTITLEGLKPGTAEMTAAIGATVGPRAIKFGPRELAHVIEYRTAAGATEPFVVTPPHAEVLCSGAGMTTWTAAPARLQTEAFADAGRLLVRVPDWNDLPDLEVRVSGAQVQAIPPSGQRSPGLAGYELARAADTITEHGRAELVLQFSGTPMLAGTVRPRRLASGAELGEDQIRLLGYRPVDGLMAGIYLVFAPWRAPTICPVGSAGIVELPEELRGAGPLRILLRLDDPWTTSAWPTWPVSGAFTCDAPGVPASEDPDQARLSSFIAGHEDLPERISRPEHLWQLVRVADDLIRCGARADVKTRCGDALRRSPNTALLALLGAGLDHHDCVAGLITTGMAAIRPEPFTEAGVDDDAPGRLGELERAGQLWSVQPAAAAILTGDMLRDAHVGSPDGAVVDEAIAQCGESLSAILRGEGDPHAEIGRFGPEAERMAMFSPDQVDALWQAAAVVPQAVLDADSRMVAARRLFDARTKPGVRKAAAHATSVAKQAERRVRDSRFPLLVQQITNRRHPDGKGGWLAVPAMSAALAVAARLAARGDEGCRSLERAYRDIWAGLAHDAPDLVAIDLIVAEALIAASDTAWTTGVPE